MNGVGLKKNTADQWLAPAHHMYPKILKTRLDFEHLGVCASPLFTVISEWTVTFSLIWKKNFGPLGINFFTLARVRHFCRGVTVVAPVLKTSLCSGFWCSDASLGSLLITLSQVLGSPFMTNLSKLYSFLVPLQLCWIKLQTINNVLFEFWMQSDSQRFFLFLSPYKFITSVFDLDEKHHDNYFWLFDHNKVTPVAGQMVQTDCKNTSKNSIRLV